MAAIHVRDLMTAPVVSVRPDATVQDVRHLMRENSVRHVPVTDEAGTVVGIVSHRDLLRSLITPETPPVGEGQAKATQDIRVRDIMASDVLVVDAAEHIVTAAQMMLASKFGCLPVVDGTQLMGILTEADFVKHLGAQV